ncbi:MAG: hypothetical protein RLZZ272_651 [Actinomycetota bacterium]
MSVVGTVRDLGAPGAGRWLVEASAGTGKTHRIEGLVLDLVLTGTPLERILVVTFTRAAAAELRRRVRRRLVAATETLDVIVRGGQARPEDEVLLARLDGTDDDGLAEVMERLRRALERIDDAVIDTIHGFCRRMLVQSALEVRLDPTAEPVEDIGPLVREVVNDLLVAELRHASAAMHALLVGRHRIDRALLVDIGRRLESEPALEIVPARDPQWSGATGGAIVPSLEPLLAAHTAALRQAWRDGSEGLWQELVAAHREKRVERSLYIPSAAGRSRELVDGWAEGEGPLDAGTLRALEPFSAARILGRGQPGLTIERRIPDLVDELDGLATAFLVEVAHRLRRDVAARKRRRRVLSFADLLVALERALEDPDSGEAVRGAVRARFDAALIDEFQDTDPVQWAIFERLFPLEDPGPRPGRLDLVGDPKQAIYAFRGADVGTYLRARASVPPEHRSGLEVNWRSDEGLVAGLNTLFDRPEHFGPAGALDDEAVAYERVVAAREGRGPGLFDPAAGAPVRLRYVPRDVRDASSDEGAAPRSRRLTVEWGMQHLPRVVADAIVELLSSSAEIEDPLQGRRRVHAGDVAVLVRTHRQAEAMRSALRRAGVPAVSRSQQRVLATREAADLERVLAALLRPDSERRLRAALATSLLGVSAMELATLDEERRLGWEERLAGFGRRWRDEGIAVALTDLSRSTGLPERLIGTRRAERALTNVRHVVELLSAIERTERLGPEALLARLGRARLEEAAGEEQEIRLESDAEAVRVVTVHGAKGLEYPVVHCPFLWTSGRPTRGQVALRLHDVERGGLVLDLECRTDEADHVRRVRASAREREREDLRLLYVALTRARHRLELMTGAFNRSGASALQHLLLGRPDRAPGALQAPDDPRGDEEVLAELVELAGASAGTIDVAAVRDVRGLPRPMPHDAAATRTQPLQVGRLALDVDRSWRRTSFTALVHAEVRDGAPAAEGIDHDETVADDGAEVEAPEASSALGSDVVVPLDDLPAGAAVGDLLHRLLERIDPTLLIDPGANLEALRSAVDGLLAEGAPRALVAALADDADLLRFAHGLGLAMRTPLGPPVGDVALVDIDRRDRLHELRFDLPLAPRAASRAEAPELADLAAVIAAHAGRTDAPLGTLADRLRRRPSRPLRGLLTGSIDLVARVDGRYAVMDHKSNRLPGRSTVPSTVGHYGRSGIERAVASRDYVLQGLLYVVALHRHLRARLADYDYDRHLVGAAFLFLRGMVGPASPRAADGIPTGVWWFRPDRALVDAVDGLLAGSGAEGTS